MDISPGGIKLRLNRLQYDNELPYDPKEVIDPVRSAVAEGGDTSKSTIHVVTLARSSPPLKQAKACNRMGLHHLNCP